jgi:hypothetical protein
MDNAIFFLGFAILLVALVGGTLSIMEYRQNVRGINIGGGLMPA